MKKLLAKDGIEVKIFEFTDYTRPNPALDQGDLDANSFQHQPYLDQQVKDRGYKLVGVKAWSSRWASTRRRSSRSPSCRREARSRSRTTRQTGPRSSCCRGRGS